MANSRPNNPIKSLSVGDVVSAGVRIYRSHFKSYFQISLIAGLWSFIPVYGWAKLAEMLGRISRLAFAELTQQPESTQTAAEITDPKKWRFLGANILVSLYYLGALLGFLLIWGIATAVLFSVFNPIGIAFGIIGIIVGIVLFVRLTCRLFIFDVAIAVEDEVTAGSSISRSMSLTKGAVGRIQWVVIVSFLIVSIFTVPVQVLRGFIQVGNNVDADLVPILTLILLTLGILSNAIVLPFWQVIKAVIYYDLRTRREGYGLKLRNQE